MTEQVIAWDRAKLEDFKRAYQKATEANLAEFKWRDEDGEYRFVTAYAYYLIEFLSTQPLP